MDETPTFTRGERLLRLRDLEQKTSLGRSTIYRYIGDGKFPRPVRLGPGTVGWKETEVDSWISDLAPTINAG